MQRILVTGANRGLGLEFVRQLLARGDRVIAACRHPGKALALTELAAAHPGHLHILPLDLAKVPRAEADARVAEALELVGLARFAKALPRALSGGMQMRVSIARGLVVQPNLLLMDEPFGALDALTRFQMQELLTQIWEEHRLTVLFVTHDVEEAVYLSDRVVVMGIGPGRIAKSFGVDMPRPRREATKEVPAFMELQRNVHRAIREASRPGGG